MFFERSDGPPVIDNGNHEEGKGGSLQELRCSDVVWSSVYLSRGYLSVKFADPNVCDETGPLTTSC